MRLHRGLAIVAFVAALVVIGTLVLWVFHLTATSLLTSLGGYYSACAFYAAESGLEMALRELTRSPPTDIDSDGTIGTISDNGNIADDPALATGAFHVERIQTTPPTLRATGRPAEPSAPWSGYRRVVEVQTR
jgi:Tfp pilus assembly protein PilX